MKKEDRIQLSDHFGYKRLIRFVMPPVIMMIFTSVYGIVDGFFVSNFAPGLPFAALNLIFPLIMIVCSVGFMFGTGGSAIVAKYLGQGEEKHAKEIFSLVVYATVILGTVLAIAGIAICRPVSVLLCKGEKTVTEAERAYLADCCVQYGTIVLAAMPAFMLQNVFQSFFVTAEKPRLGLYVTLAAGCGNILFDALLVPSFGLVGAATATAGSQCIGGFVPLLYFFRKNDSLLRLGKTKFYGRALVNVCINGSSELMTNISSSVVSVLFNAQLMKFLGYNGVSAYGIIMYVGFVFVAVFLGYAIGSAPVFGYNYGAQNHSEMKNVFKKSVAIIGVCGLAMATISFAFAGPLARIFTAGDRELWEITVRGLRIYSFSFLICGINIFASSFFTALSNGAISALLSFARTLVFQIICVFLLPALFGVDGIWASVVVAELLAAFVSGACILLLKDRYSYI